jgi:multidrug resistance protein MdtO
MTALAESLRLRRPLLGLLFAELAPREGRWAAVTRIATGCAITVAIAMVFKIPQPTYMAYIVFVISKDDRAATLTSALGGLAAVTLAIILTLGLSLIDTAEPALRLPLMALATFAAMFTARTFSLGPIAYLAGFVIVLLQSLVDDLPTPEAMTRATLWTWVLILVPVAVTAVVNLLFGQNSVLSMDRNLRKILTQLEAGLRSGDYARSLPGWRATLAPLLETARHNASKSIRLRRINAPVVAALLDALVILEAFPVDLTDGIRSELARRVQVCLHAIGSGDKLVGPSESIAHVVPASDMFCAQTPAVFAFVNTLSRFLDALNRAPAPREPPRARSPRPPFIGDAFSNPAHWQFALKTTMAVMVSYAILTLLDWPGLRTAIVTCFFVALSSLGETVHKLVLRLSGALIGGLIAGLCIVFVMPHLTDIGQLCFLIGGVSVAAAWVATSSELLSYAGLQIAFAFFLGVLQGYGPATDLTVLRDRMIGILLGNIVITIVFSSIWPESAQSGVRTAIAQALRAIGSVIGRQGAPDEASARAVQAMVRADHFRQLSFFELRMLPSLASASRNIPTVSSVERMAGAAFVVASDSLGPYAKLESTTPIVQWANSAADSVSGNQPLPRLPEDRGRMHSASSTDLLALLARRAIERLDSEVQHVASAIH